MKIRPRFPYAPGLLALVFVVTVPVATLRAEDQPAKDKLGKHAQKYDADKDGQLNDEERARMKEDAKEKREAKKQEALEKYDANKNGRLDPEEKEKQKADIQAEKEARKAAKEAKKAGREARKAEKEAAAGTGER
jgi:hypothetical protein